MTTYRRRSHVSRGLRQILSLGDKTCRALACGIRLCSFTVANRHSGWTKVLLLEQGDDWRIFSRGLYFLQLLSSRQIGTRGGGSGVIRVWDSMLGRRRSSRLAQRGKSAHEPISPPDMLTSGQVTASITLACRTDITAGNVLLRIRNGCIGE